jgi:hypothetical protein
VCIYIYIHLSKFLFYFASTFLFFIFFNFNFYFLHFFSSILLLPTYLLHFVLTLTWLSPLLPHFPFYITIFSFSSLSIFSFFLSPSSLSLPTSAHYLDLLKMNHSLNSLLYQQYTLHILLIPQQSLTVAPFSTMTEIHLNTH